MMIDCITSNCFNQLTRRCLQAYIYCNWWYTLLYQRLYHLKFLHKKSAVSASGAANGNVFSILFLSWTIKLVHSIWVEIWLCPGFYNSIATKSPLVAWVFHHHHCCNQCFGGMVATINLVVSFVYWQHLSSTHQLYITSSISCPTW